MQFMKGPELEKASRWSYIELPPEILAFYWLLLRIVGCWHSLLVVVRFMYAPRSWGPWNMSFVTCNRERNFKRPTSFIQAALYSSFRSKIFFSTTWSLYPITPKPS